VQISKFERDVKNGKIRPRGKKATVSSPIGVHRPVEEKRIKGGERWIISKDPAAQRKKKSSKKKGRRRGPGWRGLPNRKGFGGGGRDSGEERQSSENVVNDEEEETKAKNSTGNLKGKIWGIIWGGGAWRPPSHGEELRENLGVFGLRKHSRPGEKKIVKAFKGSSARKVCLRRRKV